ncbi:MAG TPA: PAS domain S-box protein, partial [Aggregatilineales bacterium]|nr:PAS domain S-box protein [Aggregatilineales bacterium]
CTFRDISERKAQEQQLLLHASLQESVNDAVLTLDMENRIQSWNRAAERIYGWQAEEVVGRKTIYEVLRVPTGTEAEREGILKVLLEQGSWHGEIRRPRKDGTELDILVSTTVLKDEHGIPYGVISVHHDITERKAQERQLQASETRYRLLAENIRDVVMRLNTASQYVYVSPSVRNVLGYEPEDLLGQLAFNYIHPDDLEAVGRAFALATEPNLHDVTMVVRYRHKQGHYVWVESFGQVLRSELTGEIEGFISSARDISARKLAEEALRASEKRFSALVNGVHDYAIYMLDPTGSVMSWNIGAERIKGYTPEEIIGHNFERFYTAESIAQGEPQAVLKIAEQTGHFAGAGWRVRKDGSRFWAEVIITALRDDQNQLIGFSKLTRDLTEPRKAQQALQEALEKEKELNELKSRFVSMASHEFRTPLATILITTETLSAYRPKMTDNQIEERLAKIREQVSHLKDIMDDVLQLARLQARRADFNPVMLDLESLCRSVIDEFQSQPGSTKTIVFTCDHALKEVKLDKKLMRQTISNLVSNAVKYSPEGKTITVSLQYTGNALLLKVRDEGIGIPESDLAHLFEPFHRATNVGAISGTGLGLTITKESIELHGGTIAVESQVGTGTTFTVTIPVVIEGEQSHDENPGH